MAKNTIKLKNYMPTPVMEEYVATAVAITPGAFLEVTSANLVQAHGTAKAATMPLIAVEDELQGRGIDTNYAASSRVQVWIPTRGDQAYALLKDGQNVVIGDKLESAGDGTLQKLTDGAAIAVALEAVDLSASGNTTAGRIIVRIV